jgi:hypothetical protein
MALITTALSARWILGFSRCIRYSLALLISRADSIHCDGTRYVPLFVSATTAFRVNADKNEIFQLLEHSLPLG